MSETTSTTVRTYTVPEKIIPTDVITESISNYTEPITFVRSKNITFSASNLKPLIRHYVYFEGTRVEKFITSKIIKINMISGSFDVGELVESDPLFTSARFSCRLCTPNHLYGPHNNPTKVFTSDIIRLPLVSELGLDATSYTSSSNILNIDISGLANESEVDFSGYVLPSMKLIGRSSGAVAEVVESFLVTDETGFLTGSFFIPDPTENGNPRFINGSNTFSVSSGSNITDTNLLSYGENEYYSMGTYNVTDANTITTRNYTIIPEKTVNETTITTTTTNTILVDRTEPVSTTTTPQVSDEDVVVFAPTPVTPISGVTPKEAETIYTAYKLGSGLGGFGAGGRSQGGRLNEPPVYRGSIYNIPYGNPVRIDNPSGRTGVRPSGVLVTEVNIPGDPLR